MNESTIHISDNENKCLIKNSPNGSQISHTPSHTHNVYEEHVTITKPTENILNEIETWRSYKNKELKIFKSMP